MFFLKGSQYNGIISTQDVFTPIEAKTVIALKDKGEQEPGTVWNPQRAGPIRTSKVTWLKHNMPEAGWIFQKMCALVDEVNVKFFGMDVSWLEDLQLTEYDASYNGFYGQHTDSTWEQSCLHVRKLSVTAQLSHPDDYEGGVMKLYDERFDKPVIVGQQLGSTTTFRSHIIHEVEPVTKGTRYSLVAWAQGPPPK